MREARILIIGAGAAGLAAADELQRHGLSPAVLEARKRIGGRIWTHREPGLAAPVELGAEFISGREPGSIELRGEAWSGRRGKLARVGRDALFRISGGCDKLIAPLAPGIRIETGTAAAAIHWNEMGVRVETSHGEWLAERIIVTVPVPILRNPARLRFDPELPSKRAAAGETRMQKAIRITIQFREDFWSERMPDLLMLSSDDPSMPTWWTTHPVRSSLITGWATGRKATNLSALPPEVVLERALASLGRCLAEPLRELQALVERHWSHDWQSDPHALGAYTLGGAPAAAEELAQPVGRTLFFAGEATDAGSCAGTVDAALSTGRRAARELLESISR